MFGLFKKKRISNNYFLLNYDYDWYMSDLFLAFLIDEFNKNGLTIDNYQYANYKYKDFKGKVKRLKLDKAKDIVSLWFFKGENGDEAEITLHIILGKPHGYNYVFIEIEEKISFDFKLFLIELFQYFKPEYGFSYKSFINNYSIGYGQGYKKNIQSLLDISRKSESDYENWSINNKKVLEGYIRDVYRINILNEKQYQTVSTGGQLLEELVVSNPKYGTLKKINANYYWEVDPKDLEWVRQQFYKEKFMI